jgi:hypothetical protein
MRFLIAKFNKKYGATGVQTPIAPYFVSLNIFEAETATYRCVVLCQYI